MSWIDDVNDLCMVPFCEEWIDTVIRHGKQNLTDCCEHEKTKIYNDSAHPCIYDGTSIAKACAAVPRLLQALELLLAKAGCDCGHDPENDNMDYHRHSEDCMSRVSARIRKGDF